MGEPDGLCQAVCDESSGCYDCVDDPPVDQVADDLPLFRNRHGTGQREHDVARFVAAHLEQYVERFAELTT